LTILVQWTLASTSAGPLRTLQFAPLGFDVFIQEVFTAWCSGGALYLPADAERADLADHELIDDARIGAAVRTAGRADPAGRYRRGR